MQPPASRNAPCPCGSGRRYKECHGAIGAGPGAVNAGALMNRALAAQQAGDLVQSESLYREVLARAVDDPDALHMLAVVRLMRGDAREAHRVLLRALDLTDWRVPAMRTNLGFVLAALLPDADGELRTRYAAMQAARRPASDAPGPAISVVLPSYNHARFVEAAVRSVFAQDYPSIELVVVDDGSRDASVALLERLVEEAPIPVRFTRRENRGAAATLNEGLALARGEFVQFLNSDDVLAPGRLRGMVNAVAGGGAAWGFSALDLIDADGGPVDPACHPRAAALVAALEALRRQPTVGLAFLASNPAVSTGNLFVARDFALGLGGFRDLRYNHDWDFCLRALLRSEPVFVDEPLYRYRLHGSNTIDESEDAARAEAHRIAADFLFQATSGAPAANPFAPSRTRCGFAFDRAVGAGGMGALLERGYLARLAQEAVAGGDPTGEAA